MAPQLATNLIMYETYRRGFVSVLHTATTRPTQAIRKTVQIYYGHRQRPYLANDSGVPSAFWRDHPDAETRAFYGVLNERTCLYMAAFGSNKDE